MNDIENLIERLRNGTALPALQALMNEAADALQKLSNEANRIVAIDTTLFDEEEIHPNCTVQIWRNSVTGETSIGWYPNK
jgi:hypothetical protein